MAKRLWIAFAILFLCAGAASAQDAKTVLQTAQKAMGDVGSIQYSATGHLNSFGQAWVPGADWPVTNLTSYTKTIDYGAKAAKEDLIHSEPNPMVKGGGRPFAGDDRQQNLVSGPYAWDMPGSAPIPQLGAAAERQASNLAHTARFPEGRDGKQRHREKGSGGNGDFIRVRKIQDRRNG